MTIERLCQVKTLQKVAAGVVTLVVAFTVACAPSSVPPPVPPPPEALARIIGAQTVFVANQGSDEVATANLGGSNGSYERFTAAIQQWGRWKMMTSPEQADLIIKLVDLLKNTVYAGIQPPAQRL